MIFVFARLNKLNSIFHSFFHRLCDSFGRKALIELAQGTVSILESYIKKQKMAAGSSLFLTKGGRYKLFYSRF